MQKFDIPDDPPAAVKAPDIRMSAQDPSGSWQEGFEKIDLRYIVDTRASLKVQLENPGQEAICFKIKTSNSKVQTYISAIVSLKSIQK